MITDKALSGKVALVTGASQGIGRAIAVALGRRGAKVVVNFLPDANGSTREQDARKVAAEVEAAGGQGAVLKGLVKRIAPAVEVTTIGEPHEVAAFKA